MTTIPAHIKAQFKDLEKFGINSKYRLAHFLSQCAHESADFTRTEEGLKYSSVERIALIFRNDVDADHDKVIEPHEIEAARPYVNNPEALANFVYANQNGNGDVASGDGWKYRGRGYIQLTGKDNYEKFFAAIKQPVNPDLVKTTYALQSAAWFFQVNKINQLADLGTSNAAITAVTKKVNGGTIGLADRIAKFNEIYAQL